MLTHKLTWTRKTSGGSYKRESAHYICQEAALRAKADLEKNKLIEDIKIEEASL